MPASASIIFKLYQDELKAIEEIILSSEENLNKLEIYGIKRFFKTLSCPMRNPNIEATTGETKYWYDRQPNTDYLYKQSLYTQIDYIKETCGDIISSFLEEKEPAN